MVKPLMFEQKLASLLVVPLLIGGGLLFIRAMLAGNPLAMLFALGLFILAGNFSTIPSTLKYKKGCHDNHRKSTRRAEHAELRR